MQINGKKVITNGKFAYDGCHKIYILEDKQDEEDAIEYGYGIWFMSFLEETYNNSCDLRFIRNWKLDKAYVNQFEDARFEY